jgi:hypothetical protein
VYYVDDPDVVTVVRLMVGQLAARADGDGDSEAPPVRRLRAGGA